MSINYLPPPTATDKVPLSMCEKPSLPPTHVIVDFGSAIPSDCQGKVMLAMEKSLREMGIPAEVFKRTMPDDSKLRVKMTAEERAKL